MTNGHPPNRHQSRPGPAKPPLEIEHCSTDERLPTNKTLDFAGDPGKLSVLVAGVCPLIVRKLNFVGGHRKARDFSRVRARFRLSRNAFLCNFPHTPAQGARLRRNTGFCSGFTA